MEDFLKLAEKRLAEVKDNDNERIVNSAIPKNNQKVTQFRMSDSNGDSTGLNRYVLSNFGLSTHSQF